jgi:hypothetical protein
MVGAPETVATAGKNSRSRSSVVNRKLVLSVPAYGGRNCVALAALSTTVNTACPTTQPECDAVPEKSGFVLLDTMLVLTAAR